MSALLTCEGLVSCQVAAIQQVQVAGKRQVLAEAAAVQCIACQLCQIYVSKFSCQILLPIASAVWHIGQGSLNAPTPPQ